MAKRKREQVVVEPIGEIRRFEMPWAAAPGRLVNPDIGLCSIALRAGDHAPYEMDVTVLDAPDHRLVRAGVWLAHRVVDDRGEWYLATDEWTPWLPAERVERMGDVDLPDALADMVRPFRRGAALGPVAALSCRREEYALRGPHAELVAVLRDDRVQVRAGGVVTASYREVTVVGVEARLTGSQLSWLTERLTSVGGARVEEFPPLAQRIGAPATGLSDFPAPRACRPGDSLENVWGYRVGSRLRALTYADLALRADAPDALADLRGQLLELRTQCRGFTPLLDPTWSRSLCGDLEGVLDDLADSREPLAVLNSERYLRLLDRLMSATRAPALGDHSGQPAGLSLAAELRARQVEFLRIAGTLTEASADETWQEALAAAVAVLDSCGVQVRPDKAVQRLARRMGRIADLLQECVHAVEAYAAIAVDALTSAEAFEAGRRFERLDAEQRVARLDFLDQWAQWGRKLILREDS